MVGSAVAISRTKSPAIAAIRAFVRLPTRLIRISFVVFLHTAGMTESSTAR
jgi:hypothetical protein